MVEYIVKRAWSDADEERQNDGGALRPKICLALTLGDTRSLGKRGAESNCLRVSGVHF